MKFLNLQKKILLPSSFTGKILKYDMKDKTIVSVTENIEENFKNKSLLVIYPYPCKNVK